jgi:hypothetical protein
MNDESSDYDNPPVQGSNSPPLTNQNLESTNNESSDYDNPPAVEAVPRSTTDSPTTQDATTEPEYIELKQENSTL